MYVYVILVILHVPGADTAVICSGIQAPEGCCCGDKPLRVCVYVYVILVILHVPGADAAVIRSGIRAPEGC